MNKYDKDYLGLVQRCIDEGVWIGNERTGKRCLTLPPVILEYDVENDPAPICTAVPSFPVSAWAEMVGYLRKYMWADEFERIGAKTWYVNANETKAWLENPLRMGENHIGFVYGAALYDNELEDVLNKLAKQIDDRGLMINFWKPERFHEASLRPCMYSHTFSIVDGYLHMVSNQRSCDIGSGLRFNSLQCYTMLKVFAQIAGLKAGKVTHVIVNPHIYEPHMDAFKELLSRKTTDQVVQIEVKEWVKRFSDITDEDFHAREYINVVGYDDKPEPLKFELIA